MSSLAAVAKRTIRDVCSDLIRQKEICSTTEALGAKVWARLSADEREAEAREKVNDDVCRVIKTFKDGTGLSLVENIPSVDDEGNPIRIWKQIDLFTFEEADNRVQYYARRSRRFGIKSNALAKRFQSMGYQIPLPFPDLPCEMKAAGEDVEPDED